MSSSTQGIKIRLEPLSSAERSNKPRYSSLTTSSYVNPTLQPSKLVSGKLGESRIIEATFHTRSRVSYPNGIYNQLRITIALKSELSRDEEQCRSQREAQDRVGHAHGKITTDDDAGQ